MNLAQVETLARVMREAQPALPIYHDDDEPKPTAHVKIKGYEGNDVQIGFWSPDDLLASFPGDLYIDEDGVLYRWNDERLEVKTPVTLHWRYGEGDEYRNRRYHRYLDMHDVAQTVDR